MKKKERQKHSAREKEKYPTELLVVATEWIYNALVTAISMFCHLL